MKHLFKNGKAIIISGPQGSGKTLIARALAKACGMPYAVATELEMKTPFECGDILRTYPMAIVVEEFSDFDWAKNIISSGRMALERMGHLSEYVNTPKFIFVSNSINSSNIEKDDRRFTLLEITASPLPGVN